MAPAPLCKTEIISFIIDELILKLWNLSSNMRKRVQMILKNKDIAVKEYNEKALILNGWVRIAREDGKSILKLSEIKKGVSNYILNTQEELDKLSSLNTKLRCRSLDFSPKRGFEFDKVEKLVVNLNNYDFVSKCSFNRIGELDLNELSLSEINKLLSKSNKIEVLTIRNSNISSLDLTPFKINKIQFECVACTENVYLPSYFKLMKIENNFDFSLLMNCKRIEEIYYFDYSSLEPKNLAKWISNLKSVKRLYIPNSNHNDYQPSTVRYTFLELQDDFKDTDFEKIKKQLPFLIKIYGEIPFKIAQKLNLRIIDPIMQETEEVFTYRPKEIDVSENNANELNKYPELFEKVRNIRIASSDFNFDCLPENMSRIEFGFTSPWQTIDFESLRKNNWKFRNSIIFFFNFWKDKFEHILSSLTEVKKIVVRDNLMYSSKKYSDLKFSLL